MYAGESTQSFCTALTLYIRVHREKYILVQQSQLSTDWKMEVESN